MEVKDILWETPFYPENGVSKVGIESFLRVVIEQGYDFKYLITDEDRRNTDAISHTYGTGIFQTCS